MEGSSALWSWTLFAGACAGLGYYYWPRDQRRPERNRENAQPAAARRRKNEEHDGRPKAVRRLTPDRTSDGNGTRADTVKQNGNDTTRKRKAQGKESIPAHVVPSSAVVQDKEPEQLDINTKQFAQQMVQNRKGKDLSAPKSRDQRVKTVKQSSAMNTPDLSASQAGAAEEEEEEEEEDDDMLPGLNAGGGDVSDMLEPAPSGPSTLRLTAPSKPQKEKVARQSKEEDVETKKQRQNRKKVEERRLQREAEEKERKAMEEKQRRAAREARDEPAKNGLQAAKPPVSSVWTASGSSSNEAAGASAPNVNGNHSAPLLDTFDAESTGSSNGGLEASTAATSTTDGGTASWADEVAFEETRISQALKQSETETGWTTVAAQPKKLKKKQPAAADADVVNGEKESQPSAAEPVLTNKTSMRTMTSKSASAANGNGNGKPKGFQALDVQYSKQRADADPNDASNWDA